MKFFRITKPCPKTKQTVYDSSSVIGKILFPVALESVCYDLIASKVNLYERNPSFNGHQDSQLHESAMANNPPSGTLYDPENDGFGLFSLGVHEHWNNSTDQQYSRNLGKEQGIELVKVKN